MVSPAWRRRLLKYFLGPLGQCDIRHGVFFAFGSKVTIKDNCFINAGVQFLGTGRIVLEENTAVAHQVMFSTLTHEIGSSHQRATGLREGEIKVGRGSWIGARCLVLPGVHVGSGCVVAAGSVVTTNCDENSLYGGVPAKRLRSLDDPESVAV